MMHELNKYSPELKKQLDALVSKPKIVGYFSVNGEREHLPNSSGLMYYKPSPTWNTYLDLNKGIESAVCRPWDQDDRHSLTHLFMWMKLNFATIQSRWMQLSTTHTIQPKFVCSATLLANVLGSTYNNPNFGWIVCAAKSKGMIYMCRFRNSEERKTYADAPKKFAAWHYKFRQYLLSDTPDKAPDSSKPVVESAEFRCIFQRSFGDHSVLFTAEMEGLDSKKKFNDPLPLNDLRFVKLKTHRIIKDKYRALNFRKSKLPLWWAQSFLTGQKKLLCGFRDDAGIVRSLKTYSLPAMVNLSQGIWNPVQCINECLAFLDLVANAVVDECDKTIYKFEKKAGSDISSVIIEELPPLSQYAFMDMS